MSGGSYQDLEIWQRAMDLGVLVYQISARYPQSEIYGMVAQTRRAAVSVASNISEGWGRNSGKEFIRLLQISHGSLRELETQLLLAVRIGFIEQQAVDPTLEVVTILSKQLQNLVKYLNCKHDEQD